LDPSLTVTAVRDRYQPESRVIYQRFPDGAVLYTPSNETYLGLNETGAKIWELIPAEGIEFEQLLQGFAAAFPEMAADELRADLNAWLDEVVALGLLRREEAVAA
jgi:ABC-type amino acid transport substrate-binding protein